MKKKHLREIQRINKLIPAEMLARLTTKQYKNPTIRDMVNRALDNPTEVAHIVSEADFAKYRAMKESGYLDEMEEVINHDVEKEIDTFLEQEFEKARKLGRLPPPQEMPKLKAKSKKEYVKDTKILSSKESYK